MSVAASSGRRGAGAVTCPRLRAQILMLLAIYPHLERDDLSEMRRYHSCADCTPLPMQHLSRDPEDRT